MSTLTASHGLTLSSTGLKLIKAYEGYRPVDRTLVSGHRVVGYGHRLFNDDPVQMSKSEAEDLLKSDLQAFEDMINENVHAPLSQGQFDALVSFAYNIGPKAFLKSDTLRALNNGRPLDAANGLDVWRKSTIDGKTYVVDALMRRRTAEKALFLRLDKKPRPAPSVDLPPVQDEDMAALETDDGLPVFTQDETSGVVARAPYDAQTTPTRRREDGPAGILMLSEVVEPDTLYQTEDDAVDDSLQGAPRFDEVDEFETPETQGDPHTGQADEIEGSVEMEDNGQRSPSRSVIADAAADISDRLDALIDKVSDEETTTAEDWPEALIQMESSPKLDDTDGFESLSANIDAGDIKDTAQDKTLTTPIENDNLVKFPGKNDEEDEAAQVVRDENETRVPSKAEIEAAVFNEVKTKNTDVKVIDSLREDDAMRHLTANTERYIERHAPAEDEEKGSGDLGFWMIMLTGFILLGGSLAASLRGAERLLGEWGPLLILSGLIIGAVMVLGAAYYALRRAFR